MALTNADDIILVENSGDKFQKLEWKFEKEGNDSKQKVMYVGRGNIIKE